MLVLLALTLSAHAAPEPVRTAFRDDGSVVGTVHLSLPADAVRARLADPVAVAQTAGGGTTVEIVSTEGGCTIYDSRSPSVLMTVRYRLRACPTPTGVVATLVESNAFSAYRTEWVVEPAPGGGSTATYILAMQPSFWVPSSIVRGETKKGVSQLLEALHAAW